VALAVDDALNFDASQHAKEALRASEQSFRVTIESTPGPVNTMSPSGELEFVSQQWLDYYGRTLDEMKGWETSDVIHPVHLPARRQRGNGRSKLGSRSRTNTASLVPMACIVGFRVAAFL
jgi:PAS domain-containing protein